MGIDPNNHKLHQSFPLPHFKPPAAGASSSESMNKLEHKLPRFFKTCDAVATSTVSFTKNEETPIISSSPNLNLDLSIALPSPVMEDKQKLHSESAKTWEMGIDLNC